jgi:hypothetical protein
MANFAAMIPDAVLLNTLGDDITYHAKNGDLAIKAIVGKSVGNVFGTDAYLAENRIAVDVAVADCPDLAKGRKFTINGKKYTIDIVAENDGSFAKCLVI